MLATCLYLPWSIHELIIRWAVQSDTGIQPFLPLVILSGPALPPQGIQSTRNSLGGPHVPSHWSPSDCTFIFYTWRYAHL
jgi:hypothetical protein